MEKSSREKWKTQRYQDKVRKRLSLTTSPSCPIQTSPTRVSEDRRGGGHFNETWLRNMKEERKPGKGVRKGRPSPFPQQHPNRVAAPGARRGRCWIQGPRRDSKVAMAFHERVKWSEPRERGPLPRSRGRTPSPANRADPRPWVGGYYPEIQKAGVD